MTKKYFSHYPLRELLKDSGAKVVAKDAVDYLITYLEKYVKGITERSLKFTEHGNRKKVTIKDIEMALDFKNVD